MGTSISTRLKRAVQAVIAISMVAVLLVVAPSESDALGAGTVVINEFAASNNAGLVDADGQTSDWFELHNRSASTVDLAGWSISDNASAPRQWTFPSVRIRPGEYLVVFASGKNRAIAGSELHTNFKLSSSGEYLGLVQADGMLADAFAPSYPPQISDVTYGHGLTMDGYFATPTPGAENGPVSADVAGPVTISLARGFYSTARTVELSTSTPGAVIRYTLDGSTPSASNGITYTGPLVIDSTTTLRAASVVPGFIAGDVATATYLFVGDVMTQPSAPDGWPTEPINDHVFDYGMDPDVVATNRSGIRSALKAIPTISVVTDADNLFDPATGIYVNPRGQGRDWERPASVELIDPSGAEAGFGIEAGIRIRGAFSRSPKNPKHSFRLFFRSDYGGSLDYPLFGSAGTDSFEKLDLRTANNYSWAFQGDEKNTMLREVFARDLQADLGHPHTRSRYYHLYLNGHYWGIYMSQERVSKEYAASYFGGDDGDYDVVKHDRQADKKFDATDGTDVAWRALWPLIHDQFVDSGEYAQLEALVDFDSLIDSQLIYAYNGETDGSPNSFSGNERGNNWYALRNRTGQGEAGKWQFFVHDGEHSLGARNHDPEIDRTGPFPTGAANPFYSVDYLHPYWIHSALLSHPDYQARLAARANALLRGDGPMTAAASLERWNEREAQLAPAIAAESARWGDAKRSAPFTVTDWANEVAWVENVWFPQRSETVLGHLDLPVEVPNNSPVIDRTDDRATVVAEPVSFTVTATDPEGSPITWSATGLPDGVAIDPVTGEITGEPATAGAHTVILTATDDLGAATTATFEWVTTYPTSSRMLLNEWNAVSSKNQGSDQALGRLAGNGGDWFELVVTEDHLDIRGWTLELSDNDNAAGEQRTTDIFELGLHNELASLRAGTIITISEDIADDLSYDPSWGDWHINLQANSSIDGGYITPSTQSNFAVNSDDWQLTIRDAAGNAVFGPAGEGIGVSGVGGDESGRLEADPGPDIVPTSSYDDGSSSTFGLPNVFNGGRIQDFSLIRPAFAVASDPDGNTDHAVVVGS